MIAEHRQTLPADAAPVGGDPVGGDPVGAEPAVAGPWAPVLVPTDRPRRPGALARPWAAVTADLDGAGPAGAGAAAFAALLFRCTGQDQVALGVPGGELRFHVDGAGTLGDLAAGATTAGAGAGGAVPVGFTADGTDADADGGGGGAAGAAFELQLVLRGDTAELRYDPALFERATAVRLLEHYRTLLADAREHPQTPVNRLRLLDDAQLERALVQWNRTGAQFADVGCLHEAFQARAQAAPAAWAVVQGGERLTYGQVNAAANRLARHLRSLGVGPDVRVGLCLDRSAQLLVAELAVLKAGGAYVPLDPDYPAQRIAAMVAGTSCAVMVSRTDLAANLPERDDAAPPLLLLDRDADQWEQLPAGDLEPLAGPDHLCYIIHTSGSTGAPKPIALQHRGVLNNIADLNTRFAVGPGDSVLALSSPSFDMSVYELLGLTIAGGTVVVPDPARSKDPEHWAELARAEGVTVWNSAPALLGLLADHLEHSGQGPLPRLRLALLGGDWVPVTLPARVRTIAPGLRFVVMGGATESSIHSTLFEVEQVDPAWTSIPYGRPMANQRTYILDEDLQPVPPGVPGELYLAGVGLARGYLDQPERTAERFLTWSYGPVREERLYRTGDAARFGADGLIELIGRKDFQVKIHGLRVELGEIETVLRAHPGVRQSVVVARNNRLLAYVVPQDATDTGAGEGLSAALLAVAAQRLPAYMVPAAVVVLERLPLTPNGKLDRLALPEPQGATTAYRVPAAGREQVLAQVYAQVLGVERIGADDDFVACGGDSIRAIQVVTRARARGLEVSARQVLQCRTVAALARAATDPASPTAAAAAAAQVDAPLADPGSAQFQALRRRYPALVDVWPLTALQAGILFESTLNDTGYDAYQMQTVFHLAGPVDAARMRAAGQALLDRYPNLRVAFGADADDTPVQLVLDGVELPWHEVDLTALPEAAQQEALADFLGRDYADHFDRAAAPLLRLALVRLGPETSELVLTTHHVLVDGWSEPILIQDLLRLYASGGDATVLPEVRGFRDFLRWLERQDQGAGAKAWAQELAGLDEPTLLAPCDTPRARARGTGEVALRLSADQSRQLSRSAAGLGVTLNTLLQGAWAVLLSGLTGRRDVVFGATVSGRPAQLPGVESMVGLFINTVPVRVDCAPGGTVAQLLTGLQDRQTALLDHHHLGLADIHQQTVLDALFDTLVAFQSYPVDHAGIAEAAAAAGIEVTGTRAEGAATYPLALIVESDPQLRLTLQYHQHLFTADAAQTLAARLHAVLVALTADPARRVGTLDVLLPEERAHLTGTTAATGAEDVSGVQAHPGLAAAAGPAGELAAEGPGVLVPELVERRAAAAPEAVAVVCDGVTLSYRKLDTWANRLAHQLIRDGAGPESVVALALPRSAQLAVAVLGTLKAGAAFVLADPAGPAPEQVSLVLTRADVNALGATPAGPADHLGPTDRERTSPLDPGHLAWVRRPHPTTARAEAALGAHAASAAGAPDTRGARGGGAGGGAVEVSHRALAGAALRFAAAAGLAPGTRLLAASPHDDAMLAEVLGALCSGAAVQVPADIDSFGRDWGWTGDVIATVAPFFARVLNRSAAALYADTVVLTGTTVPAALVDRVRRALPGARVVTGYGPAESAGATALTAPAAAPADGEPGAGVLPLGAPLGGVRAYVLDGALRPVPAGVAGELYLAGEVARGYHRQVGPTAQRFLPDPYGRAGARMYRTGDLARWSADGALDHLGSGAPQVRLRGRRVDTGQVAAALAAHPGVCQAAALVRAGDGAGADGGQLVAYVAALRTGAGVQGEELRAFAAQRLPEHLVPAAVVVLAELPLAGDGSVDLHALHAPGAPPVPSPAGGAGGQGPVGGRTAQQEAVCALVAEVLGVAQVGLDDNFFALGCNSLKATRIIGRIRRTLGCDLTIRLLFQYPSVAQLCEHLEPASAKSRPGLGKALRRMVGSTPDGTAQAARQILTEAKEQIPVMHEDVKQQAKELKEQLTAAAREQWNPEDFGAKLAADVDQRIQRSMQRGSGKPRGEDAKESQRLLKRMLERFSEAVHDSVRQRPLSEKELAQVQEALTGAADSLRGLLHEAS